MNKTRHGYDKHALIYRGALALAAIMLWLH